MANYRAIFSRDGVMAGVAGLLLRDERVSDGLARTLEGLRDTQGAVGQIASNFERRDNEPPHVSFGSLAPRIDGATEYLVGVALARSRAITCTDSATARTSITTAASGRSGWAGWHSRWRTPAARLRWRNCVSSLPLN